MATLIVPSMDEDPWPSLGREVCDLLEERSIFGPGSLKGEPYRLDDEKRAAIYRAYEVYPRGHQWAGRRRFKRVGYSVRKGLAKTELGAEIAYAELHPEGPVRCGGWRKDGGEWVPVGRPVRDPYIPLLAVTVEQVEELAYGALYVLCTEGPDADMFDSTLDRIIRLDERGAADGKAVALSNSPGARDGARTTFQLFDEPHRLVLPRQITAHETMVANLEKRSLEDPWGMYVGTAGELGEGSVAEGLHVEAEMIERGEIADPQLSYIHRDAGQVHDGDGKSGHDLSALEGRVAAIREATGSIGEYSPGQFHSIARQWDRPQADRRYLQRVWLNLWIKSGAQAFDPKRWGDLGAGAPIPDGAFVAAGFDGARFRDSTGIVLTDINTGQQQCWARWERPVDSEGRDVDGWEVDEVQVTAAWAEIMQRFDVWRAYCDPPHWTETVGSWAARWPDQVEEWWTNRLRPMAQAVRAYREAILTGALTHTARPGNAEDEAFDKHIAAAGRKDINLWEKDDETGQDVRLFILQKLHPDRKFDIAMAGCLSWQARLDALRAGAKPPRKAEQFVPIRIR